MKKIVILDDERHCTDILETMITKVNKDYKVIGTFNDPFETLDFIDENKIDLLFLDIQMPKMNGFKFLDQIMPIDFDVIFTTAYDQYAVKAFEYSAINYLLKPITEKALIKSLLNWQQRNNKIEKVQWKLLKNKINDADTDRNKIALPTGTGFEIMDLSEIMRCQSENNYTSFYFNEGNKTLICRTLKEVDALLSDYGFVRVHQSHLINPKFVKAISKQDGGTIIMRDDKEIPVSRQKKETINKLLDSMLRF